MTAVVQQAANDLVPASRPVWKDPIEDLLNQGKIERFDEERAARLRAEKELAELQQTYKTTAGILAVYQQQMALMGRIKFQETTQLQATNAGLQAQLALASQAMREWGSGEVYLTTPTTRLSADGKPMTLLDSVFAGARQSFLDERMPKKS